MGFDLKSVVAASGLCLAMAWPAQNALATNKYVDSNIDLTVRLDGGSSQTFLALATGLSPTLLVDEVLADGTRHAQFNLPPGEGVWQLDMDMAISASPITEPFNFPLIDTYLTTSGSSSLTFNWAFGVACHGNCGGGAKLSFRLDSLSGSLFRTGPAGAGLPDINTAHFDSGSGVQSFARIPSYPGEDDPVVYQTTRFSVVPEPNVFMLITVGVLVSSMQVARRRRTQRQS